MHKVIYNSQRHGSNTIVTGRTDKENVSHTHNGVSSDRKERHPAICNNMDGTGGICQGGKRQES